MKRSLSETSLQNDIPSKKPKIASSLVLNFNETPTPSPEEVKLDYSETIKHFGAHKRFKANELVSGKVLDPNHSIMKVLYKCCPKKGPVNLVLADESGFLHATCWAVDVSAQLRVNRTYFISNFLVMNTIKTKQWSHLLLPHTLMMKFHQTTTITPYTGPDLPIHIMVDTNKRSIKYIKKAPLVKAIIKVNGDNLTTTGRNLVGVFADFKIIPQYGVELLLFDTTASIKIIVWSMEPDIQFLNTLKRGESLVAVMNISIQINHRNHKVFQVQRNGCVIFNAFSDTIHSKEIVHQVFHHSEFNNVSFDDQEEDNEEKSQLPVCNIRSIRELAGDGIKFFRVNGISITDVTTWNERYGDSNNIELFSLYDRATKKYKSITHYTMSDIKDSSFEQKVYTKWNLIIEVQDDTEQTLDGFKVSNEFMKRLLGEDICHSVMRCLEDAQNFYDSIIDELMNQSGDIEIKVVSNKSTKKSKVIMKLF